MTSPCLSHLAPEYIRAIKPYQGGKPISELAREMGLNEADIVKLASNENPLGISPKAQMAIEDAIFDIARYPDGNSFALRHAVARYGQTNAQRPQGLHHRLEKRAQRAFERRRIPFG